MPDSGIGLVGDLAKEYVANLVSCTVSESLGPGPSADLPLEHKQIRVLILAWGPLKPYSVARTARELGVMSSNTSVCGWFCASGRRDHGERKLEALELIA